MKVVNNNITPLQWELILDAFNTHCKEHSVKEDAPLIRDETTTNSSGFTQRTQSIYDNYDRHTSPGLTFIQINNVTSGNLYVYSGSEQDHAPITFDEGIEIAQNFFSYKATELSEHIVCNHVMNRVWG